MIERALVVGLPVVAGLGAALCLGLAGTALLPTSVRAWLPEAVSRLPPEPYLGLALACALGALLVDPMTLDWRWATPRRRGDRVREYADGRAPVQLSGLALIVGSLAWVGAGSVEPARLGPALFVGLVFLTASRKVRFDLDARTATLDKGTLGFLRVRHTYDLDEDVVELEVCDEPYEDEATGKTVKPWPRVTLVVEDRRRASPCPGEVHVTRHWTRSAAHREGMDLARFLGCQLDDWIEPF